MNKAEGRINHQNYVCPQLWHWYELHLVDQLSGKAEAEVRVKS